MVALAKVLDVPISLFFCGVEDQMETLPFDVSTRAIDSLNYAVLKWDGDKTALREFCRLYMALPPNRRSEIAFVGLHQYEEAKSAGELVPDLEVDEAKIESAWKNISRIK